MRDLLVLDLVVFVGLQARIARGELRPIQSRRDAMREDVAAFALEERMID